MVIGFLGAQAIVPAENPFTQLIRLSHGLENGVAGYTEFSKLDSKPEYHLQTERQVTLGGFHGRHIKYPSVCRAGFAPNITLSGRIIMAWIAGIIVLVLLIVSSGFRKFAGVLIGLAALVGGFFYLKNEQEESRSLSRIKNSELVFETVTLKPNYSSYKMVGRIKNNSPKYTLKKVTFMVSVNDCVGEAGSRNCITIGESNVNAYLIVPPGQARDFEESVYFSGGGLKPKNRLEWNYSVSEIKAE